MMTDHESSAFLAETEAYFQAALVDQVDNNKVLKAALLLFLEYSHPEHNGAVASELKVQLTDFLTCINNFQAARQCADGKITIHYQIGVGTVKHPITLEEHDALSLNLTAMVAEQPFHVALTGKLNDQQRIIELVLLDETSANGPIPTALN